MDIKPEVITLHSDDGMLDSKISSFGKFSTVRMFNRTILNQGVSSIHLVSYGLDGEKLMEGEEIQFIEDREVNLY